MNYIKHLNGVFRQFSKDSRLNPSHVSLYMALFQCWNQNRFPESFQVDREETMTHAKIGSRTTYHRCLNNLNDWGYISYLPSHSRFKGSRIMMPIFGTTAGQLLDNPETSVGPAVVPYININKHNKTLNKLSRESKPKNEHDVVEFFKLNKWPLSEGVKFYNHYQGVGWKVGGKCMIEDWMATARNWMLRARELKKESALVGRSNKKLTADYLDIETNKNYGEPL
ncbi:hypothetical protein [Arenibacter sp. ARW7G5Y1]|uniref:hypothetical protein n=1 Tax=Arenibacter sp. ARW7G5Y1 TaxID=2135619 RepID=UPI000D91CA39|nr:hypothetical protein [Arenibacter sp. ARW7G5Y1]PXX23746.1 hypothetical protein C7972_11839 [Arenibacter sp. ARW7G5Y1]